MAIPFYLAMTAAEMEKSAVIPPKTAWLSCHFSSCTWGLSNLPAFLPEGSLLMLDDANPVSGHDPVLVAEQLREAAERFSCAGILLDFQRPGQAETAAMVAELCRRLPEIITVSAAYAEGISCPVCLPPVPCLVPLPEYLAAWKGREVWLEGALTVENWEVTREGAKRQESAGRLPLGAGFREEKLPCHYRVTKKEECLQFTLWRTWEDLEELREAAEKYGVKAMVGLWQELGTAL